MLQSNLTSRAISLIKMANDKGIKFIYKNEELRITLPKDSLVDSTLINELKSNKELIKTYFKNDRNHLTSVINEHPVQPASPVLTGTNDYYEITTTQLYWVNDDIDSACKLSDPVHGIARFSLKLEGHVDLIALQKAVRFIVNRHESLRSTFHNIRRAYYMQVHDIASYPELLTIRSFDYTPRLDSSDFLEFVGFNNQYFNLEEGPLCLIRVACLKKDLFIIAMKMHHVIVDTLAINILLRELTQAYNAFSNKTKPDLLELNFQFKDALSYENRLKATNYLRDKTYWTSTYQSFPPTLFIPGNNGRKTGLDKKIVKRNNYQYSNETYLKLLSICKSHAVSLFIVLQASIKSFLYRETAQNDIIFGTTIFGRDIPGFDTLVGCFCKTVLLRTIIKPSDRFKDILQKVRKSNEDMNHYSAYSLRDLLEEKMPSDHIPGGPFWVFNMQYYDERGLSGVTGLSNVTTSMLDSLTNNLIPIDLQINFKHDREALSIQANYDSSRFTSKVIDDFFVSYLMYIDSIDCL